MTSEWSTRNEGDGGYQMLIFKDENQTSLLQVNQLENFDPMRTEHVQAVMNERGF